jgi:hypothetical protein
VAERTNQPDGAARDEAFDVLAADERGTYQALHAQAVVMNDFTAQKPGNGLKSDVRTRCDVQGLFPK